VSANVVPQKTKAIDPQTKALVERQQFYIVAEGTNLEELFALQAVYPNDIIFNNITCDNTVQIYQWFGKLAATAKIVNEVKATIKDKVDLHHIYLLADEMV